MCECTHTAFREGNTEILCKREVRAGKMRSKAKTEARLKMNKLGLAWRSMNSLEVSKMTS